MRRVIALACVLASCGMGVARGADGALVWSYRYVLATSTVDTQLLPIVSGITTDSSVRDQATCDLLAEVLLRLKAEGISAKLTEVQIVRVLTNVPIAARYHDVLTKLAPSITDKGAKIQLTQYRREFPRTKGEQYVRGTIDLDALRRGFVEAALAAKPTMAQAQALADLPTNATMDEMFAIAGKPALVMSRDVRVADLISIEVRQLWFYYRGVGRVTYDYQHDSGWHAHGFVADPMAFESSMPYRTKATELGMPDDATLSMIQLVSATAASIKSSAQSSYRRGDPPQEYLDTAAELLLQNYAEIANTGANDAYAWICNVLSDYGGPRYAKVMRTVEQKTTDPKLKKFAGQALKKRDGIPATPYVAGSVSLAAQSAKYPSLYPDMTLIRGLL